MPQRGIAKPPSRTLSHHALSQVLDHLAARNNLTLQTLKNLGKIPTLTRNLRNSFPKTKRTARSMIQDRITPKKTVQDLVSILVKIKADQTTRYRVGRWTFLPRTAENHPTSSHRLYWLGPPGPMFGFKYGTTIWPQRFLDVSPTDILGFRANRKQFAGDFYPHDHQGFRDFIRRVCIEAHATEIAQAQEMASDLRTLIKRIISSPGFSQRVGRWRYDPQMHQVRWIGPPGLMFGYVFAKPILRLADLNAYKILDISTNSHTALMPADSEAFKKLIRLSQTFVM